MGYLSKMFRGFILLPLIAGLAAAAPTDDYVFVTQVEGKVGNNGCNICEMYITICGGVDGICCQSDLLNNSGVDDWKQNSLNVFTDLLWAHVTTFLSRMAIRLLSASSTNWQVVLKSNTGTSDFPMVQFRTVLMVMCMMGLISLLFTLVLPENPKSS